MTHGIDAGSDTGRIVDPGRGARPRRYPDWVPEEVVSYLAHVQTGRSIRSLARACGCEPSTISRRVRRIELKRDDVLVDMALSRLGKTAAPSSPSTKDATKMSRINAVEIPSDRKIEREAGRVLRRLAEQGACLALAEAMETAVVVREPGDGGPAVRTATVERAVAEALALKGWVELVGSGRILRYRISSAGRAALKRLVAQDESRRASVHGTGYDDLSDDDDVDEIPRDRRAKVRYNLAESPLATLARRRDKCGQPFLTDELVAAGERLREDFELSQTGPQITQNWESLMIGRLDGGSASGASAAGVGGAGAARERVAQALRALGPGLGDVALRCCCFLEGLETTEQRMGWSARSGKIVLRIALQRLKLHYDENSEHWSPLIG